jgi:multidrug efflux system outer membrane protein
MLSKFSLVRGPGPTTLLLAAALAGCAAGPDFVAPRPNLPAAWTAEALAPSTAAGTPGAISAAPVGDPNWWAQFNDPILSSLITRAAKANLDLSQALLRIAAARAQTDIAAGGRWPTLAANAGYTRQRISEATATTSLLASRNGRSGGVSGALPGLENPFPQAQVGFDASWELDLFGRVRRSVEAAEADAEASIDDSRDVLLSLEGEVARAYIDLRGAQRRSTVLEESLETARQLFDLTRERRQAGMGNDLDVANAGAQRTSTEALQPPVRARITQDINRLSFLLALDPAALAGELTGTAPLPPLPPEVPIGLPGDLVRRRPDIRAAEARLHAATARIGVATADMFPRLTLNAAVGFQAEHSGDLGRWASRFFSFGPQLDLPIFSGGRRQATVRLQDATAREAAVAYARTVLAAVHEVENALVAFRSEQSRRTSLDATAAQNRDALDLARQRYVSGVSSFLEVLDAERNRQQTELALTDSAMAGSIDLVALYKALGGGWILQGNDASPAYARAPD